LNNLQSDLEIAKEDDREESDGTFLQSDEDDWKCDIESLQEGTIHSNSDYFKNARRQVQVKEDFTKWMPNRQKRREKSSKRPRSHL